VPDGVRTDKPFKKITSKEYVDPHGDKAQIEILGEGQQFVAYAIHPVTNRPYSWFEEGPPPHYNELYEAATELDPLHCKASELIPITEAQGLAIVAEFEREAERQGWPIWEKSGKPATSAPAASPAPVGPIDDDSTLGQDQERLKMTDAELQERLDDIPNDGKFNPRGEWFKIGAAIHDQNPGEAGFAMFDEWSAKWTGGGYDAALTRKLWDSLGKSERARKITARWIVKLSNLYRTLGLGFTEDGVAKERYSN